MKIKVVEQKNITDIDWNKPQFVIGKETGTIVFSTCSTNACDFTGTVVFAGNKTVKRGEFGTDWNKNNFRLFVGKLKINQ